MRVRWTEKDGEIEGTTQEGEVLDYVGDGGEDTVVFAVIKMGNFIVDVPINKLEIIDGSVPEQPEEESKTEFR